MIRRFVEYTAAFLIRGDQFNKSNKETALFFFVYKHTCVGGNLTL